MEIHMDEKNELKELAYKGTVSLNVIKDIQESFDDIEITAHMDNSKEMVFDPFATLNDVVITFAKIAECYLTEKEILFVQGSLMGCVDQIPSDDFVDGMKNIPEKLRRMKEIWVCDENEKIQ